MNIDDVVFSVGIAESDRGAAVALFDEAFGQKLAIAVSVEEKRLQLLHDCMLLDYVIGAFHNDRLIGIAGFHTEKGSLTGGAVGLRGLISLLGVWGGLRAALILSAYDRKPLPKELVMDGISVHSSARGHGIGGRLLFEIKKYAALKGFATVRLDVIDTNPRARQLYERSGFRVTETESFFYLQKFFGFGGVATMVYEIGDECDL